MRPYWSSAARLRSYCRWAASSSALALSSSSRSFCTLPMAFFSFSHWAFLALNSSRISASSFWNLGQMLLRQASVLLLEGGLLNLVLDDLPLDDVQLGGHGVDLGADHGAGLVDQVDGLVG